MDKKYCSGCRNDFYNGKNNLGVMECWSLKTAKRVRRKKVSIHQRPPWNQKSEFVPSCYHCEGYIFVEPKVKC